jgi:GDP-L-fucose synthase
MKFKDNEIMITGANGMVGQELKNLYPKAISITHKDFDLTKENDIKYLFYKYQPKVVIHLAARVGGVMDNIKNPAIYFDDNILMNTLMVKYSKENNVERFIGILSSCIFPDAMETYPMKESDLHLGPPTPTNFSYGYAKRSLAVQIEAYNQQYGTKYNYVMPCNLYGEHDKIDEVKSHFIAALLVKVKDAVDKGDDSITLYGDGTPLRQFMHAKDLALILKRMIDDGIYDNLNIATEENLSINEMAIITLKATNNEHLKIFYDVTKPNGQFRKDISIERLKKLIPNYNFIKLQDGIKDVYERL